MSDTAAAPKPGKKRRGFASMTKEQQRIIASKGGRAAHKKGTAHEWTSAEARIAGSKGGTMSRGGRGKLQTFEEAANAVNEGQEQAGQAKAEWLGRKR